MRVAILTVTDENTSLSVARVRFETLVVSMKH